jgi:polyhydroxyalkanoate synthesis repressor PhaR
MQEHFCCMVDRPEPEAKKLEIKKYPNRRYYDSLHSRHLTLEEIRGLIHQGYDIQVTDAKSGSDITAQVLTQIILELETPKLDSLPVPLLVRLIRMNDQLVKDFIEKYFNQALKSFFDYQQMLEQHVRKSQGLTATLPTMAEWTKSMMAPFAAAFSAPEVKKPEPKPERPPTPASSSASQDLMDLITHLKGEVEQLKAESSRKPRKRKAR